MITSLVEALAKLDGDAVVLDSGSMPYVVANGREVAIETGLPPIDDVAGSIAEVLPAEQQSVLERLGAVRYELPPMPLLPFDHLTLIVVRLDTSLWVEIQRSRQVRLHVAATEGGGWKRRANEARHMDSAASRGDGIDARVGDPVFAPAAEALTMMSAGVADSPVVGSAPDVERDTRQPIASDGDVAIASAHRDRVAIRLRILAIGPYVVRLAQALGAVMARAVRQVVVTGTRGVRALGAAVSSKRPPPRTDGAPVSTVAENQRTDPRHVRESPRLPDIDQSSESLQFEWAELSPPSSEMLDAPSAAGHVDRVQVAIELERDDADDLSVPSIGELWTPRPTHIDPDGDLELGDMFQETVGLKRPVEAVQAAVPVLIDDSHPGAGAPDPSPAVALPPALDRLLQVSAARGASTLYLRSQACPAIRVDGVLEFLEEESSSSGELEAMLLQAMPEPMQLTMQQGGRVEWISDVPGVGPVLCSSFWDQRGVSAILGLSAAHWFTAEALGLSAEVQALVLETEGLILITGARASRKNVVITALVDLANRLRRDHVVTLEERISVVHKRHGSAIDQREVHGNEDAWLMAMRAAIADNPDVLAIDEIRADSVLRLALHASGQGRLVIAGLPAPTATAAVESILRAHLAEGRRAAQALLSERLRGVVAQTVVRQLVGEGRIAREILLNTPTVAALIAAGRTSQLPAAIEEGVGVGMVSLNDSLLELVRSNTIDVRDACRGACDRAAFLGVLQRAGIDISSLERPARS